MKLFEILIPPLAYSLLFGKVIGDVIEKIGKEYNSLHRIEIADTHVDLEMYAGSPIPAATMMRAAAKQHKLPIMWVFEKENRGDKHGYIFHFNDIDLMPSKVIEGVKMSAAAAAYDGVSGIKLDDLFDIIT